MVLIDGNQEQARRKIDAILDRPFVARGEEFVISPLGAWVGNRRSATLLTTTMNGWPVQVSRSGLFFILTPADLGTELSIKLQDPQGEMYLSEIVQQIVQAPMPEPAGRPSEPYYDYAFETLVTDERLSVQAAWQRMNHPEMRKRFGYEALDWERFRAAMKRRTKK